MYLKTSSPALTSLIAIASLFVLKAKNPKKNIAVINIIRFILWVLLCQLISAARHFQLYCQVKNEPPIDVVMLVTKAASFYFAGRGSSERK